MALPEAKASRYGVGIAYAIVYDIGSARWPDGKGKKGSRPKKMLTGSGKCDRLLFVVRAIPPETE